MYQGINMTGVTATNPAMDWAFADRIRKSWKGKFLIKGIDTHEGARLCLEHGIDGIMVSNHGGRATETLRPTIEALPEVVAAVGDRIPVFVDGGFRRGGVGITATSAPSRSFVSETFRRESLTDYVTETRP